MQRPSSIAIVSAGFGVHGLTAGAWLSRLPELKALAGVDASELATALLAASISGVAVKILLGRIPIGFGGRRSLIVAVAGALTVLPISAVNNLTSLVVTLGLAGAAISVSNVALNTAGVEVEQAAGRSVMPRLHATSSAGVLLGGVSSAIALATGASMAIHFTVLVLVAVGVAALVIRHSSVGGDPAPAATSGRPPPLLRSTASRRALGLIGIVAFCGSLCEGAVVEWFGIYLRHDLGSRAALGAAPVVAFTTAMVTGRVFGGRLIDRCGVVVFVRTGAIATAGALTVALLINRAEPIVLAVFVAGFGLSVISPTLYSTAGHVVDAPRRVAFVSLLSSLGFLGGPPIIGFVADTAGLQTGLGVVCVSAAIVAGVAGGVRPPVTNEMLATQPLPAAA